MSAAAVPGLARRAATEADLPTLLTLNQDNAPHVGDATAEHLARLVAMARGTWVVEQDGELAGFVIVMAPGLAYDSLNYRWFSARYPAFAYIDRVVVAGAHRGRGVGRWLYEEVVADARTWAPVLLCEVNLRPPNPVSQAFHAALGFTEVGQQDTEGGAKRVVMLARPLAPEGGRAAAGGGPRARQGSMAGSFRHRIGVPALAAALLATVAGGGGAAIATFEASPAQAAPAPGSVFVIGDSVMVAAASSVAGALPGRPTTVDAQECRATAHDATFTSTTGACRGSVPSGLTVLRSRRAEVGDTLVLELGANDSGSTTAFAAAVEQLLAEAATIPTVVWLTVPEVRPTFVAANQVLRDAAARHPNLVLADWAAIAGTPGYTVSDGLHLQRAGAAAMAQLIATTVTTRSRTRTCADPPSPYPSAPSAASGKGYWMLDSLGHVTGWDAPFLGDLTTAGVAAKPVALASTASGDGYWIVDRTGAVHAFGAARALGGVGGVRLNASVISMAMEPDGAGYWLVGADGGVFSFGGAPFLGSLGAQPLNSPVISAAATASGRGYFLIAGDGGVFTFGDALFRGSMGASKLNAPVTSMSIDPQGRGYWLYARDGGVFTFGGVAFHGSVPGLQRCTPPTATVAMRPTDTGEGYWVLGDRGQVYAFGDAVHHGDQPALAAGTTVIDLAVRHAG